MHRTDSDKSKHWHSRKGIIVRNALNSLKLGIERIYRWLCAFHTLDVRLLCYQIRSWIRDYTERWWCSAVDIGSECRDCREKDRQAEQHLDCLSKCCWLIWWGVYDLWYHTISYTSQARHTTSHHNILSIMEDTVRGVVVHSSFQQRERYMMWWAIVMGCKTRTCCGESRAP